MDHSRESEMGTTRRKFSREFKVEAVRMVTEGRQSIAETARELGVNPNLLGRWKKQANENGTGARSIQKLGRPGFRVDS